MKIAALVHFAPPHRVAGSEQFLHSLLEELLTHGHEAHVVATEMEPTTKPWNHRGVDCQAVCGLDAGLARIAALRPDLLVTHQHQGADGIRHARTLGIPSVFVCNGTGDIPPGTDFAKADLTVHNSDWVADHHRTHLTGTQITVHPPVRRDRHRVSPGDRITLVNLNRDKGAAMFAEMARRFPHLPFLGVTGGYGHQITTGWPSNVEIIGQTADMRRDVWSRTRLLLVPSAFETYGLVPVEAAASGIPSVLSDTTGLREAMSTASLYAHHNDIDAWARHLRALTTDPLVHTDYSWRAHNRFDQLEVLAREELAAFVQQVERLVPRRAPAQLVTQ